MKSHHTYVITHTKITNVESTVPFETNSLIKNLKIKVIQIDYSGTINVISYSQM